MTSIMVILKVNTQVSKLQQEDTDDCKYVYLYEKVSKDVWKSTFTAVIDVIVF